MQERQRSWSVVRAWTSCRVKASFHVPSVALEWAATASSATAASTGCTRNAVGSSAWQRILTTDVHGARELHAPRTADHRGEGGGSLLLLSRRHALSSKWLWTFNHNTCENRLEKVQGAATSSLFMLPLFQDRWACVHLLCAERDAPCQWDLAIDKSKAPTSAAEWQGSDQTDLQCQAARRCHHLGQWTTWAAWHWESWPHSEGEKAPLVWTCGTLVQFEQPFTYRLRESVGLGGPRWHGSSWQRGIAESGSSPLSWVNPHDRNMWGSGVRSAMHAASQLSGRGPTDVDVAPVPEH